MKKEYFNQKLQIKYTERFILTHLEINCTKDIFQSI